ncbi:MAG: nucleoside phosphorylase [Bacteroidaceae bacterium]
MKIFEASELIINNDGSVFHLHLQPQQLADKIILVGDPDRVSTVSTHFESIECENKSREFHSCTGLYKDKRIMVVSTGIGCDNIDIVINELDALANIDFKTRKQKDTLRSLELVRIGTCGGLQEDAPIGTFIASQKSIGFDGLLNFYKGRNEVCDLMLEQAFTHHMKWNPLLCAPYVIDSNPELLHRIAGEDMIKGITISCGGFFGPQGRELRIPLADPQQNKKVESFDFKGLRIMNYEMESSALHGLARLLGHKATTCCMVIANRRSKEANANYKGTIDHLIKLVLDRI